MSQNRFVSAASQENQRKHKMDSCLKTPARSILTAGIVPPHSPAEPAVELAEGIEPPTL